MDNLKPCPFCGNSELDMSDVMDCEQCGNFEDEDKCPAFEPFGHCSMVFVVCSLYKGGCGASSGWYNTKKEAIDAWNRRCENGKVNN